MSRRGFPSGPSRSRGLVQRRESWARDGVASPAATSVERAVSANCAVVTECAAPCSSGAGSRSGRLFSGVKG